MSVQAMSYVLDFSKAELGARFGVNTGVRVGHMDYKTGTVY